MQIDFYIAGEDIDYLKHVLSSMGDFAILESIGNNMFSAQRSMENLDDGVHKLWVIATGSLQIKTLDNRFVEINDPFIPWIGAGVFGDPSKPMISVASQSSIVQLTIRNNRSQTFDSKEISTASWIGNRYKIIGEPAAPAAQDAWKKLRATISKSTVKFLLDGTDSLTKKTIFFFPCAADQFRTTKTNLGSGN